MPEPFSVEIKGLEGINKMLTDLERKQIPFTTANAINSTAFQMMKDMRKEIVRVFDSPTSFTVKSQVVEKATKKNLVGRFRLKDDTDIITGTPPAKYLQPQIKGGGRITLGVRGYKGFENLLRRKGFLLSNQFVMPAKGTKLNKFGNVSPGKHKKILSDLRANLDVGVTSNRAAGKKGKFFVLRTKSGSLPAGVYERSGRGGKKNRAVFIFVHKRPRYKPKLAFDSITRRTFDAHYEQFFNKAFYFAMRTAR